MPSALCRSTHPKLAAGKCPWCGGMIIDGQTLDERIVSAHQKKDATFERYRDQIRPILLNLEPTLLAVIELRFLKGRTIQDIARELNVSIGEATSRLSKAQRIIREEIRKLEI